MRGKNCGDGGGGGKRIPLWVPVSEGVSRGRETGLVCDQGVLTPGILLLQSGVDNNIIYRCFPMISVLKINALSFIQRLCGRSTT